ncbi:MAG TPA: CPBP family intramembrane glutamic endopeptidase [Candidatus Sulfotelmatobacter sp.]|jgi:membrane protease YdiL (CAAX protease family)|nr:CPBP family intramembrane glutamic endopeptidase [Candidatus Sulfotelmatobacter sp.]
MPWDFWLIFLFLSVVIPWRGYTRLKKLLSLPSVDTKEKLALYAVTMAFQWALVGLVAWRALARGLTIEELGLRTRGWEGILASGLLGAMFIGGLQWVNLRRIGKMEGEAPELLRKLASRLLPVNLLEYLPYSALAITAGVCEEFLYRGFGMAALSKTGLPLWVVVIVTSVLFGLAHAYQGRGGVVSTGIFGVLLAIGRLSFGSLVPVMMWHAGLDLAAGVAAPKYLLKQSTAG